MCLLVSDVIPDNRVRKSRSSLSFCSGISDEKNVLKPENRSVF